MALTPPSTLTHTQTLALEEAFIMDDEEGKKKSSTSIYLPSLPPL